jgi:hypothetical protein
LTGVRLVSVPFSDHAAILVDSSDELGLMLAALRQKVDTEEIRYVEFRPTRQARLNFAGFENTETFHLHTINLHRDLGSIYRGFHKDCVQRKIRRAEREGLEYTEGKTEILLQQFYRLLSLTHGRHHTPTQPISWFRNLANCLGDSMKIRIASKRGQALAGMITLSFKETMTYKYGASDAKYHSLGATSFLFWRSIQEAKNTGLREFDMGRSDINQAGLVVFKEHWGAQRIPIHYWRYPARVRMDRRSWEFKTARSILALAPSGALRTIGSLLYRHMG